MQTALEILKYILPALVVFVTVYYLMKNYLDQQYKLASLDMRKTQYDKMLPIKLQAYERLALFCERISPDNLAFRLASGSTNAMALSKAMLVAIQQEWEHNLSQQIYVSDNLWQIIALAKNDMQATVGEAASLVSSEATPSDLLQKINELRAGSSMDALTTARKGLHEETQLLF